MFVPIQITKSWHRSLSRCFNHDRILFEISERLLPVYLFVSCNRYFQHFLTEIVLFLPLPLTEPLSETEIKAFGWAHHRGDFAKIRAVSNVIVPQMVRSGTAEPRGLGLKSLTRFHHFHSDV